MKINLKTLALCAVILAAGGIAQAQYVLGSFQGAGDPTDAGWTSDGVAITTAPTASFVNDGVTDPNGPLSLQLSASGAAGFGNPSALQISLSPSQIAAFEANSWLTFTFSLAPSAATAGYNQIYNLYYNTVGTGQVNMMDGGNAAATWGTYSQATGSTGSNQNGEPNFYLYSGYGLQSETVTVNYSSFLPTIEAGIQGQYLQIGFQGNTGGGSPAVQDFNNVVLSTTPFAAPEPASIALLGLGALVGTFAFRRRKS